MIYLSRYIVRYTLGNISFQTPHIYEPRYSGFVSLSKEAGRWRYVGGRNV
jgi:hypothetical protein